MKTAIRRILGIALLFGCGILFSSQSFSNSIEKKYGGTYWESARALVIMPDGGYLIAGTTTSYTTSHDTDIYIFRTNASGDSLWAKRIGGAGHEFAYQIISTSDGNYVVAGYTSSTGAGYEDAYVVKINSSGDVLWAKTQGGPGSDAALDVKQTSDGGYILTGTTSSGDAGVNAFLWKVDASGNTSWFKNYGGNMWDSGHCVLQTSDSGYLFLGQTMSTSAGDSDFMLTKTSADGTVQWSKNYGGADYERGQWIETTSDGNFLLTGDTKTYGAGDYDVWLLKVSQSGETLWTRTFGGTGKDISKRIERTKDGGYVIAGNYRSLNGPEDPQMWIMKINAEGNKQWEQFFGGQFHEHAYFAKETPDGGWVLLGHTVRSYVPVYNVDIYLVKIAPEGGLGINENLSDTKVSLYPNPLSGSNLFLNVSGTEPIQSVVITDLAGKMVLSALNPGASIQLNNLSKGIYLVKLNSQAAVYTRKLVVE